MLESIINILEKTTFGAFLILLVVWAILKAIYVFVKQMLGY